MTFVNRVLTVLTLEEILETIHLDPTQTRADAQTYCLMGPARTRATKNVNTHPRKHQKVLWGRFGIALPGYQPDRWQAQKPLRVRQPCLYSERCEASGLEAHFYF